MTLFNVFLDYGCQAVAVSAHEITCCVASHINNLSDLRGMHLSQERHLNHFASPARDHRQITTTNLDKIWLMGETDDQTTLRFPAFSVCEPREKKMRALSLGGML